MGFQQRPWCQYYCKHSKQVDRVDKVQGARNQNDTIGLGARNQNDTIGLGPATKMIQLVWGPATKMIQLVWGPATKMIQLVWGPATKMIQLVWGPATKMIQLVWGPLTVTCPWATKGLATHVPSIITILLCCGNDCHSIVTVVTRKVDQPVQLVHCGSCISPSEFPNVPVGHGWRSAPVPSGQ